MAHKLLAVLSALALYACATEPKVKVDSDPATDFSRYRTYSWAYAAAPQGINPLNQERVKTAIDRVLASRGYTQAQPGDFAIGYTLGARDKVKVTDLGPYGAFYPGYGFGFRRAWAAPYSNVDVRNVTEGTLAIDIYDVQTKRPVWHGLASKELSADGADPADIDAAVTSLLAKFPPGAPKAE